MEPGNSRRGSVCCYYWWDCAKIMTEYKLAIDGFGLDVGAVAFFAWGSNELERVSGAREFPQLVNLANGWRFK